MPLLACGSNGRGQLGLGHAEDTDVWTPVALPVSASDVRTIVGGGNHTVLTTYSGRVFAAGSNDAGELAQTRRGDFTDFVEIKHPEGRRWRAAAAGWAFTVLVDDAGYLWEAGSDTQKPIEAAAAQKTLVPLRSVISNDPGYDAAEFVAVAAGMAHCVAVTTDGAVWGWGAARKSQLGPEFQASGRIATPLPLPLPEPAGAVACGRDFSVIHYVSGRAAFLGTLRGRALPEGWDHRLYAKIHAGWTSIVLEASDGSFVTAGNNSHGQLATPPAGTLLLAAGSEHYLAYNGAAVHAWGWGEHGNTPPSPASPAVLEGAAYRGLFAGCATSFAVAE